MFSTQLLIIGKGDWIVPDKTEEIVLKTYILQDVINSESLGFAVS